MYWCFHCYDVNNKPRGTCEHCGHLIEEPPGLPQIERLVWALRHPDGDRAILAARRLGALGAHEAVPALWTIARGSPDPYLAAVALHALIRIEGVLPLQELLEVIAKDGPLLQRQVAQEAINKTSWRVGAPTRLEAG